jgi:hypothetical protein
LGVKVRERPKGSGIWWLFINHQGKRKAKKIGRNKRLAKEVAEEIFGVKSLLDSCQAILFASGFFRLKQVCSNCSIKNHGLSFLEKS